MLGFAFRYRHGAAPGYEYISPALSDALGYSPEEVYADPDFDRRIVHPRDAALLEELIRNPFGTPSILRLISKKGSVVWLQVSAVPIVGERNELVAVEGLARVVGSDAAALHCALGSGWDVPEPVRPLSRREAQVLGLVARGWTNAAIGQVLGISQRTAERHVAHIFFKLGVRSRAAAVALGFHLLHSLHPSRRTA